MSKDRDKDSVCWASDLYFKANQIFLWGYYYFGLHLPKLQNLYRIYSPVLFISLKFCLSIARKWNVSFKVKLMYEMRLSHIISSINDKANYSVFFQLKIPKHHNQWKHFYCLLHVWICTNISILQRKLAFYHKKWNVNINLVANFIYSITKSLLLNVKLFQYTIFKAHFFLTPPSFMSMICQITTL